MRVFEDGSGLVRYKIFISSVQREFAKERKALAEYVRKDAILGWHRSIPVNPLLAQGMYLRGYIEHVGSGTGDIIEKCRESGLPPPQWESEDDGLTIILRRATIASQPKDDRLGFNASQTAPKHHGDALDDALEARLLDALRKESSLDQVELSKVLGVSRATVQRCFKRLLDASKVVRVGGKRFGHWEVIA